MPIALTATRPLAASRASASRCASSFAVSVAPSPGEGLPTYRPAPAAAMRSKCARMAASSIRPPESKHVTVQQYVLSEAGIPGSAVQPVQPGRVPGEHLVQLAVLHTAEILPDCGGEIRIVAGGVRKVARPQDPVRTNRVAIADPVSILDDGVVEIVAKIIAG